MQHTSILRRGGLLILLSVTLFLCPPTWGQAPAYDFLPLAVGNSWIYDYALDNDVPSDFYSSYVGTATYVVLSREVHPDSTVWRIRETRNVQHHSYYYLPPHRDTTVALTDSMVFDFVEYDSANHRFSTGLYGSLLWSTPFAFAGNLSQYTVPPEFYRYHPELAEDTLRQRADFPLGPTFDSLVVVFEKAKGVREIFFSQKRYVGSDRRVHHTLRSTTVTSIPTDPAPQRSVEFNLLQNYPNPFNPMTTIGFALPHRSPLTLTVFDALGQQVAVVADGLFDAGYHEVRFDASRLSSGVYFYRLRATDYLQTRKLVLLR
jgi:hypothetical protein